MDTTLLVAGWGNAAPMSRQPHVNIRSNRDRNLAKLFFVGDRFPLANKRRFCVWRFPNLRHLCRVLVAFRFCTTETWAQF